MKRIINKILDSKSNLLKVLVIVLSLTTLAVLDDLLTEDATLIILGAVMLIYILYVSTAFIRWIIYSIKSK